MGLIRTVLFNWGWARHTGGTLVFRIEDTDAKRDSEESYQQLLEAMRWLGIDWDEGVEVGGPHEPYRQSQRGEIYADVIEKLKAGGYIYPSYSSPEETEARHRAAGRDPKLGYDGHDRDLTDEQIAAFEAEGRAPVWRLRSSGVSTRAVTAAVIAAATIQNSMVSGILAQQPVEPLAFLGSQRSGGLALRHGALAAAQEQRRAEPAQQQHDRRADPQHVGAGLEGRAQQHVVAVARGDVVEHPGVVVARRQPLEPRTVDINGTVVDIAKLLRPTLGEQIEINSVLAPDVASVHIDPSQLANSLLNMAINARDAMPNGGKLLFETSNIVLDEAYAAVNPDITPGRYVLLAVSDTGTGMSHAVQDKVFEPFFTTKEVGKGSGLGMSMVYGFVKQSGGHIKIYSEEGHGTTIKLYLPPARGQAEVEAPAPEPPRRGSEVILVVEDDQLVRNYVVTQLGSLGYKTIAVPDSRAALALVDKGEKFDLLFTDVIMPGGMNGRQLADEVRKRRPGLKVLYTSGYTENAIVHHGRLDEGVLLLAKPYRKAQLASMLQQALGE